ncbi:15-hydroxyprostaglandin dehydrogenase [NAD(+)]-like [Littorina saxatilis]|uniref:15-hydroxyprostaglandin dehydrogenase [NAD(+)]-like n=1 Tax=Littorina saxatilis TaxID=31220 RepID=UPI0038B430A0
MELRGKGVFITGAATGIGRALLPSLLDRGARVLFCDVNEEAGRRARDELLLKYGESDVIFMQCDVSDAKQLTEAFQRAVNEFRAVEICTNNAAIMDERVWEKMIDINQVGVIRGSNLALEHMRRDKGGRGGVIINTASVNGLYYGQWMFPVYMCTKKAIVGFTTSWANSPEQEQHGVRWGVVCPDGTATPLTEDTQDRIYRQPQQPPADRSRWLRPADVALAFMTLLDDDDSNGDVIKVSRDRKIENAPVIQTVLEMDRSSNPVDSLRVKTVITTPTDATQ